MESTVDPLQERIRSDSSRIPACDNCKDRKTKCDRGKPCSSCVTAGIHCRITRSKPEKRQRIIISAKYDEALERVDTRLQEVLASVRAIQHNGISGSGLQQRNPQQTTDFPVGTSSPIVSDSFGAGYKGDSSFDAQVRQAALKLNTLVSHLPQTSEDGRSISHTAQQINDGRAKLTASPLQMRNKRLLPFLEQHPEFEKNTLPSSEPVLRLLRLVQNEKHRFFADVSVIDEQHFIDVCRDVFFAINPYTIYTWSIVNTGLYYLFVDLSSDRYPEIGVDTHEVDRITEILARNVQASVESFRVCLEPSIEACQAMAMLGTFCMKSGQITRSWNLFSAASRMCLDLGLHKLPHDVEGLDQSIKRKVFWFIYIADKGLALTLGRTQSIHHYDVSTDHLSHPIDVAGITGKIATAMLELAILEGEILLHLFSQSGHKVHPHGRAYKAREFRSRLRHIQTELNKTNDAASDSSFWGYSQLLNFLIHSISTVVCTAVASDAPGEEAHACTDCVTHARQALTILVEMGNLLKDTEPTGWALLLNAALSLMPFTPYMVLVTHVVTEHAPSDLAMLIAVNAALKPVAETSPFVRHVFGTCKKLYQFAEAKSRRYSGSNLIQATISAQDSSTDSDSGSLFVQESCIPLDESDVTMSLIDWPMMSSDLDLEIMLRHA
ncbi:hypothetical protein BGZ63DRAFT_425096 [Mariannaea sp. PMI_226]|nr:hypothetical protein BGZ63DRAFT_425096 [Mariannaea sp. PMI_226]